MTVRIDVVSVPGDPDRTNEDYAGAALTLGGVHGVAVVLDGVTPPADGITGCVHGVPWFTDRLANGIVRIAGTSPDTSLANCLDEAVALTALAHLPECDLSHVHTPQTTVVIVRWDSEQVEYLVLSDSVLLLEGADGAVRAILETRLDDVQRKPEVRALHERFSALPAGSPERAAAFREFGQTVERLRNKRGGFFTAAADPNIGRYAVTGTEQRDAVRSAVALTDGASRWKEMFRLGDWGDLVDVLKKAGPRAVVEQVRAAEGADLDRRMFPRFKTHDDASILCLTL